MSWQEDVSSRLGVLISVGEGLNVRRSTSRGGQVFEKLTAGEFLGWRTRAITALSDIVGQDHPYTKEFPKACESTAQVVDRDAGVAILKSLRDDIDAGYLRSLSNLISGEVFSDFLDMAQHLLDQGYKDPAASLTGAVLEDGLRRIADNNDITVTDRDDLSSLRDKCAQKQVFDNLVRQQITAWTTLRNSADHGKFDQYTAQQVGSMISDVRSFLASNLG